MEIEEKYLNLLGLLIHDKRNNMNGMISSLMIEKYITGYGIYYQVYTNRVHGYTRLFMDDIIKGNAVFLLPFSKGYLEEIFQIMEKQLLEISSVMTSEKI